MRDYLFDSYLIIYLLIFSINRYLSKAGKGTRTLDLLITNQLRYQLRYSSNLPTLFIIKAKSLFDKSIFSFYLKIFHQIYFNDKTCY